MENINKPRLVFFQWKNKGVSMFVQKHKQQHVKCLSEFFEVIVINENCDYQEIADKYQPDLTLFESGVNYQGCQRLEIKNTHACPEIPKLGFHNGDSWCEARPGFLSDMEHWGIETFFSISTTTAEHTPEIAENLFVWPNFIDADIYQDYNQPKIIPVLFTGAINPLYPWRQRINQIVSQYYPSLICPHQGYNQRSTSRMMHGEQYARTINASWFVPTCGSVEKEVVRKHFEIPASKSCLLTEKTPALEAAGFVDMYNCVFANENDVLDRLDYLFQNLDELEKITNAGYQLVHARHTLKQRDQIFQWFNLYKNIKPEQKIIQTNPFEPLTLVEKSSGKKTSHIICDGLMIKLLHQGDEKLWAGKYEEAENFYRQYLHHKSVSPEAKLKLALCNLYKGNAETAFSWIIQPIRYTLENYKAIDPDPVEWAYFMISLLCQGKLDEAIGIVHKFPWLCHPELERTRWVINLLDNIKNQENFPCINQSKYRFSVHQLPNRSLNEWVDSLCIMLEACHQFGLAERLRTSILSEYQSLKPKNTDKNNWRKELFSENFKMKLWYGHSKPYQEPYHVSFKSWFLSNIKPVIAKFFRSLESMFGYFLPFQFSKIKFDEFFWSIRLLTSEEDINTVLIIGASAGEGGTESILGGIRENRNKPTVFCMNISTPKFVKLQKRYHDDDFVKCYMVSDNVENSIKLIKQEHKINFFDVVFIDASELTLSVELEDLFGAMFVLLDDINSFQNYKNHQNLINKNNYILVTQNPSLRNGYAVFKKVNRSEVINQSIPSIFQ